MDISNPEDQKTLLSIHQSKIKTIFDNYKNLKTNFGVYFTPSEQPYLTLRDDTSFSTTIRIGKKTNILAYIYDCSQDFSTQSTTFLT